MCGIFAALGPKLAGSSLENVFAVLHHRGPDGRGSFSEEAAGLTFAHTRLAVIDLATGEQPMHSEDGNLVLICNGEIYDFERIRRSLEAKGHAFRTKSDSEVILNLYREYGLGCFDELRGEFAFLLYDKARRLLIAARDRFGIKPLYFSRLTGGGFVFASEMKAIFASGLVAPRLNVAAFDPLVELDPVNMQFPFEEIEHVPPASFLTIDVDTHDIEISRYWSDEIPAHCADAVPQPFGDAPEECARLVLHELEEAVRLRLRADVPVGLYLSGGVDSAFIGALMQRNLNLPLHSFSISFEGSDRNEQRFARRAADVIGTAHHELAVSKQMLWDNVAKSLWFSELPFVSLAPVGKFLLSELARKHVTVVITGEGADEIFLGYRTYFEDAIRETRNALPRGRSASAQARRLKLGGLSGALLKRLSLFIFHRSQRHRLASARMSTTVRSDQAKPVICAVQQGRLASMPFDILCFLGDREEMAHSLEARLPFLDHKLYEVAKEIPVDFKMRDGREKAVLRDAADGILPDDLRLRRKSGFMLTSDPVDLFGEDQEASADLTRHLSRDAFEGAQIFSYGAYRLASLLARLPMSRRFRSLKRLRRNSNKVLMYMMQANMLHDLFVCHPPWIAADKQETEKWRMVQCPLSTHSCH
ncbi:asparagine synthase (glutamine-hydrolyzing) [Sphingomonas limnosediminicola]|uniref:asparagine synthase (glutamine-hydrolyzing) n=2 Tax=Sphingomonas limnosediminicola TaxID=940133 RepID=A0ABP7L078_9SPHN